MTKTTNNINDKNRKKEYPSQRIQSIILNEIQNGELLPGERLSSERSMSEKYDVSRMAVQYAMKSLEKKGYLERRKGSGTFVKKHAIDKINLGGLLTTANLGITATLKSSGARISNKVITKGFVSTRFLNNKLGVGEGEKVYVLHRVRYSNEEPFAIEYSSVPAKPFRDIDAIDFTNISLYDYMESYGLMPTRFNEKLQLVEVNARETGYLEIGEGEPVYYTELIGFDKRGNIVEYTESFTRYDKAEMTFETRV